jgi:excisionase family DNA binding protein
MRDTKNSLLTVIEIAQRLRVSPSTVARWARSGRIPQIKLSRNVRRFDWNAVFRALKRNSDKEAD